MYWEYKKLNSSKINDPVKKRATELNRIFSKKEVQMAITLKKLSNLIFCYSYPYSSSIPQMMSEIQFCLISGCYNKNTKDWAT
jgi:hypothetical protein